ncbi:MAG: glycosyltransferase family 39 protein [bacterium]
MSKKRKKVDKPSEITTLQSDKTGWLKGKWSEYLILGSILTIAFVIRLIYLSQIKASDPNFSSPHPGDDIHMYVTSAKQILDGTFPKTPFEYNPLYYYFLAVCYIISGDYNLLFPRMIQFFSGIGVCLFSYLIGKQVFNKQVGLLSAFLCAVCGTLIFHEGVLLSTALTTFFITVSLFFFIKLQEKYSLKDIIIAGIFLGIATLSQPNVILLLPIVCMWLIFTVKDVKQKLVLIGVTIAVFSITISPVTIRNYVVSHKIILLTSAGGFQFWMGNNEHSDGVFNFCHPYLEQLQEKMKKDDKGLYLSDVITFAKTKPYDYIKLQIKKCLLFWGSWDIPHQINYELTKEDVPLLKFPFILTFGWLAVLGLTGMLLSLSQWKKCILLYLFIFGYSFVTIIFIVVGRYRPPILPLLAIFSGFAIYYLFCRIKEQSWGKMIVPIVLLVIFTVIVNHQALLKRLSQEDIHDTCIKIKTEDGFIIRDASDKWHGGKTAQLNAPEIILKKDFLISKDDLPKIKEATIGLTLGAGKIGSVVFMVNNQFLTTMEAKNFFLHGGIPGEGMLGSISIGPIPLSMLKQGVNAITIHAINGGALGVPVDNFYNHSRSFLSSDGGAAWEKMEGEYMIELKVKTI